MVSVPTIPPLYDYADFNAPLSTDRAAGLIRALGDLADARVADLGCGWGEFLLRVLEAEPKAHGLGIDTREDLVAEAARRARSRGVADRAAFEVRDAATWDGQSFDVAICVGSTHAWGGDPLEHTDRALVALRRTVRPGGLVLLGEAFWERTPTAEQLELTGIPLEQYGSVADLVDRADGHGFDLRTLSQATLDEWDSFESRHGLGHVDWLSAHPDGPDADQVRDEAAAHRRRWLRGWRGTMGLAYLTLVRRG